MKFIGILLLHILCISAGSISPGHDSTEDLTSRLQRSPWITDKLYNSYDYQITQLTTKISELSHNISSINKIKTDIVNINAKTSRIEQLISQRDEDAKRDVQKIISTLEGTKNQLNRKLIHIENKLHMINTTLFSTLSRMEYDLFFNVSKINNPEPVLTGPTQVLKSETTQLKDMVAIQANIIQELSDRVNIVDAQIQEFRTLLLKATYRIELVGHQLNKPKCNLTCNIAPYCAVLSPVKNMMDNISDQIQQLPRVHDMQAIQDETVTRLKQNENVVKNVLRKEITNLEKKLHPNRRNQDVGELRLCGKNNAANINQNDFEKLYTQLRLVSTHIMDNNRKVDDGVQKILSEIGLLVEGEAANINTNLIRRFNGISNDIAKEEQIIVSHLTTKMEQEINKVLQGIYFIREYITNVKNGNVTKH